MGYKGYKRAMSSLFCLYFITIFSIFSTFNKHFQSSYQIVFYNRRTYGNQHNQKQKSITPTIENNATLSKRGVAVQSELYLDQFSHYSATHPLPDTEHRAILIKRGGFVEKEVILPRYSTFYRHRTLRQFIIRCNLHYIIQKPLVGIN